jgi:hypothetical protein
MQNKINHDICINSFSILKPKTRIANKYIIVTHEPQLKDCNLQIGFIMTIICVAKVKNKRMIRTFILNYILELYNNVLKTILLRV